MIDTVGEGLEAAAMGPGEIALRMILTFVSGGLDIKGHEILAQGATDYASYTRQMNESPFDWCAETDKCTDAGPVPPSRLEETRGYDSVGNVTSANTTLPAGTNNQAFCYDELNRLTWAGSTGTPPCGTSLTPGSLTSAQYTQTFGYDVHNRLTTGPAGSYSYDGVHLDAVTQTSGGYTGSYDDAGDLQCRAPNSSQTCQGTQTGQQMSYDQLRRLLRWQNTTNNPTVRAHYAYDGKYERVIQNTGPVTYYLGGYTEVTVNGSTTTNYYGGNAISVNGTISYLVNDGIGSASESLSSSGSVQGAQLFAPYGSVRFDTTALAKAIADAMIWGSAVLAATLGSVVWNHANQGN